MIWGLSFALHEHALIDQRSGRVVNADLADYRVSVNGDVAPIEALLIDEEDPYLNPLDIKAVGEIGITGTGGAIGGVACDPREGAAVSNQDRRPGGVRAADTGPALAARWGFRSGRKFEVRADVLYAAGPPANRAAAKSRSPCSDRPGRRKARG